MNKDVKRLSYRLSGKLYEKIVKSASARNITVNAEINRVLYSHYIDKKA